MSRTARAARGARLLFDARYIRTDFHDGISRFSLELARATAEAAAASGIEVAFIIHDDAQLAQLPAGAKTVRIHPPTSPLEPFTALRLNRFRPDVVFSPMQTIGSIGRRYRLILTLHDMIYYRHRTPPRELSWPLRLGWRIFHLSYVPQRLVLNRADVVATVSETSKRQFAEARLTRRPVVVLANAPQRLGDPLRDRADAPPRDIVYMGSFMPYKNVETLVRAMAWLPEHRLHLLSRIGDARVSELKALAPAGADIRFHRGVSDAEYAELLEDGAVLATLSRDEGYGLPIAEALGFGVPAVVSDLEVFREVAGDGALFVDPEDPEAFASAVRSLDDGERRKRLIAAGIAHAESFTWERTAARLLETTRALAEPAEAGAARTEP